MAAVEELKVEWEDELERDMFLQNNLFKYDVWKIGYKYDNIYQPYDEREFPNKEDCQKFINYCGYEKHCEPINIKRRMKYHNPEGMFKVMKEMGKQGYSLKLDNVINNAHTSEDMITKIITKAVETIKQPNLAETNHD